MRRQINPYCVYVNCSGPTCPYPNLHPSSNLPEPIKRWWVYLAYRKHWDNETQLAAAKELTALDNKEHSCDNYCRRNASGCEILADVLAGNDLSCWHAWVLGKYEKKTSQKEAVRQLLRDELRIKLIPDYTSDDCRSLDSLEIEIYLQNELIARHATYLGFAEKKQHGI